MHTLKYIFLALVLAPFVGHAQSIIEVEKTIDVDSTTLWLDSNSIVPNSFKAFIKNDSIKSVNYELNWVKGTVTFYNRPNSDSIKVSYRTFNFNLNQKYSLRNTNIIEDEIMIAYNEKLEREMNVTSGLSANDELDKVGSISRGVAFGNNQNLSVNSNLDLQLSGKLSKDYTLVAALSDRNIPIQPEGTTSNIQEFDQVFVNLKGKGTNITLGDFFVQNEKDEYFFKTFKKSQGISGFQSFEKGNKKITAGANVGVTRGRFTRNTFNGEEGNQGPYRLTGENGGIFIIVIAGTERVFVNGKLLQRGEQNEYIVDYNTGEITFTPNQLITSLDRIVVEFQYADNSFERSLAHGLVEAIDSQSTFRINFYQEQDNRNKPFYTTFSTEDIITLAQVGDNLSAAVKESSDTNNITDNTIRYKRIDTTVNNVLYPGVYVQTSNEKTGIYRVTYSLLGANKGNYIQESTLINGRIYKWVAPLNGVPQGNYEPIIQLIAPKRTALITGLAKTKLGNNTELRTDLAMSRHDENTFSNLDGDDDNGFGGRLIIKRKDSLKSKKIELITSANAEYTSSTFKPIERFRGVEFNRTWNRQLSNQTNIITGNSQLFVGGGSIKMAKDKSYLKHETNLLSIGQTFSGNQNQSSFQFKIKQATFSAFNSLVNTILNDSVSGFNGKLISRGAELRLPLGFVELKSNYTEEINSYQSQFSDSLFGESFGLRQFGASIENADTSIVRFNLGVNQRTNTLPFANELKNESRSNDLTAKIGIGKGPNFNVDINTTYRIFTSLNGVDSLNENTLLNRVEYRFNLFKGLFQTNSYYQIGTGRERQFEVLYLFVGQGLGDFTWADLNNNGEQDLGEFRPEEFNGQGSYVRTIVNSNNYVNAISNEFYQSLNFTPAVLWAGEKGLKKFLSKFSNQTNGSINRKTTDANSIDQFNPFALNVNSDYLISTNAQIRNSVYFNRLSSKFSLEYTYLNLLNKNLFVYGFEGQQREENLMQLRWNTSKVFSLFPVVSIGTITSISESFENKNYILDYTQYKLKGQIQKGSELRFAVNFEQYNGIEPELQAASVQRNLAGVELTYSKALKGIFTLKLDYIDVNFTGEQNSPLGFNMLNGLQPGQNITWSVISNYQISKQAQIGINYEGRYAENNRLIQTGSVNARWLF
ncbi:MAG: hypothetical protein JXQ87_10820 [Bacteroidia bacterium]